MVVRTRGYSDPPSPTIDVWNGFAWNPQTKYVLRQLKEQIYSDGHPNWPYSGGPFSLYRSRVEKTLSEYRFVSNGATQAMRGRRLVKGPGTWADYSSITLPSPLTDLTARGTQGWRMYKPGNPVAGPVQFLAEVRQLPTMPLRLMARAKTFRDLASSGGKEYLNVEFGWKPFLRDISSFLNSTDRISRNLDFLRRNNGKWIRRKGMVSADNTSEVFAGHADAVLWPPLSTWLYWNALVPPKGNMIRSTQTRYWFSGKFRYYIPDIETPHGLDRVYNHLAGWDINPSTLWQIMPWSWLIDWFGSVGDVIDNLTNNVDGLVAQYAYIMGSRYREDRYEVTERLFSGQYQTATGVFSTDVKMRASASPFGFGLLSGDLSDRQVAILTALGLSRRF